MNWTRLYITCEKSGGLHLAKPGLTAGRQAGRLADDKPAPIMLKILPIILSRISQKFCPLFFCSLPIILIKFF